MRRTWRVDIDVARGGHRRGGVGIDARVHVASRRPVWVGDHRRGVGGHRRAVHVAVQRSMYIDAYNAIAGQRSMHKCERIYDRFR